MINIYMCKIDLEKDLIENNRFIDFVSEKKKQKLKRNSRKISAQRTLLGEILVRIAICSRLKIKNEELVFCKNKYNKPLLNNPTGYFFNISHSGDWVVCAFSSQNVGIDVEQIKPIEYSVAEYLFNEKEYSELINKEKSQQLIYFFELWTIKESYVKAIGKGLRIPLNSFCISEDGFKFYMYSNTTEQNAYFQHFKIDESHIMSICSFNQAVSDITLFSLREIESLTSQLNNPETLSERCEIYDKSVSTYAGEGRYSLFY